MRQNSARPPARKAPENPRLPRKALVKELTNLRELNSSVSSSKDPFDFEVWVWNLLLWSDHNRQQEKKDLPPYRKRLLLGFNSAYTEGWALYAERLAEENGWSYMISRIHEGRRFRRRARSGGNPGSTLNCSPQEVAKNRSVSRRRHSPPTGWPLRQDASANDAVEVFQRREIVAAHHGGVERLDKSSRIVFEWLSEVWGGL